MIDTVTTVERNDLILPKPDGGPNIGSGRRYGYLRLRLDRNIPVLPGQFAMIKPHGIYEPLLRRAMAYYRSVTVGAAPCVDFIYQILGRGTDGHLRLRPRPDVASRRADRRAVRRAVAALARSADGLRLWRLRRLRGRG